VHTTFTMPMTPNGRKRRRLITTENDSVAEFELHYFDKENNNGNKEDMRSRLMKTKIKVPLSTTLENAHMLHNNAHRIGSGLFERFRQAEILNEDGNIKGIEEPVLPRGTEYTYDDHCPMKYQEKGEEQEEEEEKGREKGENKEKGEEGGKRKENEGKRDAKNMQASSGLPVLPRSEDDQGEPRLGFSNDVDQDFDIGVNERNAILELPQSPSAELVQPLSGELPALEYSEKKGSTPRLVIDKLVLTNFKSYAGKQTIGPFNPSFSAIVGPNGSGKSNVIDALLFVFGFRATKMRQSKIKELIHNSEEFPNLDSCSVDVLFHNVNDESDGSCSSLKNSELTVSRQAFRNNSSKYFINGKESSYSSVTELLKSKDIDLTHKRFLILQGEVESIAQMKPKAEKENDDGLLEYLEDIIGTTNYKLEIEKLMKLIEDLNEICIQKEERFELVERDKKALESKKEACFEFLRKEKLLVSKKNTMFQAVVMSDGRKINELQTVVDELNESLELERSQNQTVMNEIQDLETESKKLVRHADDLNQQRIALTKREKQIQKETVSVHEKLIHLEKTKQKSEDIIVSNKSQQKHHTDLICDLELLMSENDRRLKELTNSLMNKKDEVQAIKVSLADKTKDCNIQLEILANKLEPFKIRNDAKEKEIKVVESKIEILKKSKLAALEEISDSQKHIQDLETKYAELLASLQEKNEKLREISLELVQGEAQVNKYDEALKKIKTSLNEKQNLYLEAKSTLNEQSSENTVLCKLMNLRKQGILKGFHGRLGDLGEIDSKYDIAISTAATLNDLVVEDVETAQLAIEYLRKHKLGFARFIVLNKLKSNMKSIDTPYNVPRLFDLIRAKDSRFLPAFYSVLRDTLVVSSIEQANNIFASKRSRIITLKGELVEMSGTLTGGGRHIRSGGMKVSKSVSYDEVRQLEAEYLTKEQAYKKAEEHFLKMQNLLSDFRQKLPSLEGEIKELKVETEIVKNELQNVQQNHENLVRRSNITVPKVEMEILAEGHTRETLLDEFKNLKSMSASLENQIKEIESRILEIGGLELQQKHSQVESIIEQIEAIHEQNSSSKLKTKRLENENSRFDKSVRQHTEMIQKCKLEIMDVNKSAGSSKELLNLLRNDIDELNTLSNDNSTKLEQIEIDLEHRRNKVTKFRSTEVELQNSIEKHGSIIKATKRRVEELRKTHSCIKLRDVSELLSWMEPGETKDDLIQDEAILKELSPEELKNVDLDQVRHDLHALEEFMVSSKVDVEVLLDYAKRYRESQDRKADLNSSVLKRDSLKIKCEELKIKRLDEFMLGFNTISITLKEMYQLITMGGNAELELVDSLDPFSEGILFSVMPPKKSWKNISNLSGGEKTLSSLALVFALHRYKPTPLYVMDEIDAALDFRNVSIVANYIKERTKNAQFIVISLRNNMFELSKQLVGIYKVNNMTRSISLQNIDIVH